MRRKKTTTVVSATIIVSWFFFLNTHLLVVLLCLIKWRLVFPGVGLSKAVLWEPGRPGTPLIFTASFFLLAAGIAAPAIFFRVARPKGLIAAPFMARYFLFEMAATLSAVFGVTRGNPLLASPVLTAVAILYFVTYPTWRRLEKLSLHQT